LAQYPFSLRAWARRERDGVERVCEPEAERFRDRFLSRPVAEECRIQLGAGERAQPGVFLGREEAGRDVERGWKRTNLFDVDTEIRVELYRKHTDLVRARHVESNRCSATCSMQHRLTVLAVIETQLLGPLADTGAQHRADLCPMNDIPSVMPRLPEPGRSLRFIRRKQPLELRHAGWRRIEGEGKQLNHR
jgi:hypothetical protein